jgi:hypothetical protein
MPMVISSTIPGVMEMSIFTVGDMLAMFLYSKESGVGIGFLNQSICTKGIKSLVSIIHKGAWSGGGKTSCDRKSTQ